MSTKATRPHLQVIERRESRFRARSYGQWCPTVISSAKGSVLRDINGEVYLDFHAGGGALNYGHNDPDLQQLLIGYLAGNGIVQGLDLATESKSRFLSTLERVILRPRRMQHRVRFTDPAGDAAVMTALALARKATGRRNVIAFTQGLHGINGDAGPDEAATSSCWRQDSRHIQGIRARDRTVTQVTQVTQVTYVPYDGSVGESVDTAAMLENLLDDPSSRTEAPAAVLVETVHSGGAMTAASAAWMQRIADLTRRHGALLIVDDTSAGCGRTGTFFSAEPFGVVPDIVILGTSLSGYGLPMSMLLIDPAVDDLAVCTVAGHHHDYCADGAAFVTATAALDKFWRDAPGFEGVIARRSRLIEARLLETAEQVPGAVTRGRGMFQGLDVGDARLAEHIQRRCVGHGLLVERCGARGAILTVLAPLTTDDALLDRGLEILHRSALGAVAAELVS